MPPEVGDDGIDASPVNDTISVVIASFARLELHLVAGFFFLLVLPLLNLKKGPRSLFVVTD
jgi:hypothetical protein